MCRETGLQNRMENKMKQRKIPQRMCVGCGEMKTKKELMRVVALPTGEIELDRTGKKSGRGAYVCNNPECFKKRMNPMDSNVL